MRSPALRPSERFALRILREEGKGEASDRRWLVAMMQYRSRYWRKSTYERALQQLWRMGFACRWQAGSVAFYKISGKGLKTNL